MALTMLVPVGLQVLLNHILEVLRKVPHVVVQAQMGVPRQEVVQLWNRRLELVG
jgi:hypothetical protein